jgi:hypothetical protein
MDCRVKPGNDAERDERLLYITIVSRLAARVTAV